MDRALFAAASGMAAQQQNLDTIADGLANADVAGFKVSVQRFGELSAAGEPGLGTVALGSQRAADAGKTRAKAAGPFDVAIDGSGFFYGGRRARAPCVHARRRVRTRVRRPAAQRRRECLSRTSGFRPTLCRYRSPTTERCGRRLRRERGRSAVFESRSFRRRTM